MQYLELLGFIAIENQSPWDTRYDPSRTMARIRFAKRYALTKRDWHVGQVPIVYRVRIFSEDGVTPQPIPRAAAVDPEGILDIGESKHGQGRLDRFARVALGERLLSHSAGEEFSTEWGYDFASVFPVDRIWIDVLTLESKGLAEAIEALLLESYRRTFKDRPPLNASLGKAAKVELWLESQARAARVDGWLDLSGLIDHLLEDTE